MNEASAARGRCAGEIKKEKMWAAFSAALLLPIGSKSGSENGFCGI